MKTPQFSRPTYGLGRHTGNRANTVHSKQVRSSDRGQTLVEFALSLTITLLMIFGLIDFSRAVYTASVVQWAAQEGARAGTVDPTQVQAAVEGRLTGLDTANLTLQAPVIADDIITVQLSYQFEFLTPIITPFAPDGITMNGEASMLIR